MRVPPSCPGDHVPSEAGVTFVREERGHFPSEFPINPNSEVGHMFSYRLSSFSRNSDSNIMPYIALVNYEDSTFKGALQHVIIQPIFYSILEDYKEKNK